MSTITSQDRIPLSQKLAFSLGEKTSFVATTLMTSVMWLPFFNIGLGISPVALGFILMVLRAWDAITDPVMGHISDNARTRWGRRRPFLFVGAFTTALLYPLIWHQPESVRAGTSFLVHIADWIPFIDRLGMSAPEKATTVYVTLVGLMFFTSYTMWSMPYYGLQLELTPNYDERTRLTAFMALVGKLTSLVTSWSFAIIVFVGALAMGDTQPLAKLPEWLRELFTHLQPWLADFAAPHAGEKPIVVGMRIMCWVIALSIICLGIMPALFVKERYYDKETSKQPGEPFWKGIRESLRCVPLWSLIVISFFLVMGYASIGGLGQYVSIYYVCNGDLALAATIAGVKGTVISVAGILMLPLFAWLGELYDKRTVVMMMLCAGIFGHLMNYFLMTPDHPYLQVVTGAFEACALTAIWMFLPSMKADVADWDEQHTHRRREGGINAFYSWFIKAAHTVSMGMSGVVLQLTGFHAKQAQQPPEVLGKMFFYFLLIPALFWSLALAAAFLYPITRKRSHEIRATLEARRGVL